MINSPILPSASGATMTSVDLRDVINTARSELGENKVRNDQLVSRIEDELCGELGVCKIIAHHSKWRRDALLRFNNRPVHACRYA